MVKTISSAQTFLMKVIFPIFWITGFGFGTLSLWLNMGHVKGGGVPPAEMKWQFLVIWILGTTFILWACSGLKRVRIDSKNLYISNFRREIVVPLSNLMDVTENRWINIHPVTLHFRMPTDFGQTISFMPTARFFAIWSAHPIVAELRRLANLGAQ